MAGPGPSSAGHVPLEDPEPPRPVVPQRLGVVHATPAPDMAQLAVEEHPFDEIREELDYEPTPENSPQPSPRLLPNSSAAVPSGAHASGANLSSDPVGDLQIRVLIDPWTQWSTAREGPMPDPGAALARVEAFEQSARNLVDSRPLAAAPDRLTRVQQLIQTVKQGIDRHADAARRWGLLLAEVESCAPIVWVRHYTASQRLDEGTAAAFAEECDRLLAELKPFMFPTTTYAVPARRLEEELRRTRALALKIKRGLIQDGKQAARPEAPAPAAAAPTPVVNTPHVAAPTAGAPAAVEEDTPEADTLPAARRAGSPSRTRPASRRGASPRRQHSPIRYPAARNPPTATPVGRTTAAVPANRRILGTSSESRRSTSHSSQPRQSGNPPHPPAGQPRPSAQPHPSAQPRHSGSQDRPTANQHHPSESTPAASARTTLSSAAGGDLTAIVPPPKGDSWFLVASVSKQCLKLTALTARDQPDPRAARRGMVHAELMIHHSGPRFLEALRSGMRTIAHPAGPYKPVPLEHHQLVSARQALRTFPLGHACRASEYRDLSYLFGDPYRIQMVALDLLADANSTDDNDVQQPYLHSLATLLTLVEAVWDTPWVVLHQRYRDARHAAAPSEQRAVAPSFAEHSRSRSVTSAPREQLPLPPPPPHYDPLAPARAREPAPPAYTPRGRADPPGRSMPELWPPVDVPPDAPVQWSRFLTACGIALGTPLVRDYHNTRPADRSAPPPPSGIPKCALYAHPPTEVAKWRSGAWLRVVGQHPHRRDVHAYMLYNLLDDGFQAYLLSHVDTLPAPTEPRYVSAMSDFLYHRGAEEFMWHVLDHYHPGAQHAVMRKAQAVAHTLRVRSDGSDAGHVWSAYIAATLDAGALMSDELRISDGLMVFEPCTTLYMQVAVRPKDTMPAGAASADRNWTTAVSGETPADRLDAFHEHVRAKIAHFASLPTATAAHMRPSATQPRAGQGAPKQGGRSDANRAEAREPRQRSPPRDRDGRQSPTAPTDEQSTQYATRGRCLFCGGGHGYKSCHALKLYNRVTRGREWLPPQAALDVMKGRAARRANNTANQEQANAVSPADHLPGPPERGEQQQRHQQSGQQQRQQRKHPRHGDHHRGGGKRRRDSEN